MAQVNINQGGTVVNGSWAVRNGIIGGIIAGIVFAMAEMIAAWVTQNNFLGPLHMIAGIPLQTPPDKISDTTAIIVGLITHMVFSMVFGVIVAYIVASVPALRTTPIVTVVFATIAGFILWPLDFYVIGPIVNAPWFAQKTDPIQQFLWHTFAFGTVLGLYLASQLPRAIVTTSSDTTTTATTM